MQVFAVLVQIFADLVQVFAAALAQVFVDSARGEADLGLVFADSAARDQGILWEECCSYLYVLTYAPWAYFYFFYTLYFSISVDFFQHKNKKSPEIFREIFDNLSVVIVLYHNVVCTALDDRYRAYESELCFFLKLGNGERSAVTHGGLDLGERYLKIVVERTCIGNVAVNALNEG